MIIRNPKCPTCGQLAVGTVEKIVGVALVIHSDDDTQEYEGTTEIDWNAQQTERDNNDLPFVCCDNGHQWATEIENL